MLAIYCSLAACSMDRSETARVVSPSGQISAILTSDFGGGAAGVAIYSLYLTEGKAAELKHPNFVANNCTGLTVAWLAPKILQLNYPQDCAIKKFVNFWYSRQDSNSARPTRIEIVLAKTTYDNSFAQP